MTQVTRDGGAPGLSADADLPNTCTARAQTLQELEDFVRGVWAAVLHTSVDRIDLDRNFFSLGGDSLLILQVMDRITTGLYPDRPDAAPHITEYFAHTTVRALAQRLSGAECPTRQCTTAQGHVSHEADRPERNSDTGAARGAARIAIIGLSGRFPGAPNIETFWSNLRAGVESLQTFSDAELLRAGVTPETLHQPGYVKRGSYLEGVDRMDAEFFGLTPREAALTCPQQRLLLECAEEALELAGYGARDRQLRVGVFVSAGPSAYVSDHLYKGPGFFDSLEGFAVAALNSSPATRISYLLDLTGPSMSIDTACSSSLVDVHQACQSLLQGECDMALAGGASVTAFAPRGYHCEEDGVVSPDGRCRPFDNEARGTVFTSGAGIVLLKPLEKALRDRDTIYAVILGSAINNDGKRKVGYTAPGLAGQSAALSRACANAQIDPSSLQYIETHGTGTSLGDPIEISALQMAFPHLGERGERCALGSLKGNVGHLQVAAGVAGLIKTALALHHREIPPSAGFRALNSAISLEGTGFYVSECLRRWSSERVPRRAGVSSFGIGGTNAHVILEEAPVLAHAPTVASALECPDHAGAASGSTIGSVPAEPPAHLLIVSARTSSALRGICADLAAHLDHHPGVPLAEVAHTLRVGRAEHAFRAHCVSSDSGGAARALHALSQSDGILTPVTRPPAVIFMFPGQGSQHPQMMRGLYHAEPIFREHVDRGASLLLELTGTDIRSLLGMTGTPGIPADELVRPLLFVLDYALAQLWMSCGVKPAAMIGQGVGEYVAACVAGVLTPGELLRLLVHQSVSSRFAEVLRAVKLQAPRIPYISNLTGQLIQGSEATSSAYWTAHLWRTVELAAGIDTLAQGGPKVFLEVGPGSALCNRVRPLLGSGTHRIIPSSRPALSEERDIEAFLGALGKLWQTGVPIDWSGHGEPLGEPLPRVPLPTYPFERRRHWIEPHRRISGRFEPAQEGSPGVTPRGKLEQRLTDLWSELLGVETIGPADDFFELGGDSLLAAQLGTRSQSALGRRISAAELVSHRTIARLADLITTAPVRSCSEPDEN